jgi:hypothetical protein
MNPLLTPGPGEILFRAKAYGYRGEDLWGQRSSLVATMWPSRERPTAARQLRVNLEPLFSREVAAPR